jgi:uncharacterized membrane protein
MDAPRSTPPTTSRLIDRASAPPAPPPPVTAGTKSRLLGVDAARGVALIGMIAVHVFDTFDDRGRPTVATVLAWGKAAAAFVLIAGVSLALMTGGRRPVHGRARTAAAVGIAARAAAIGLIGLALGYYSGESVGVILAYYAVLFVLAIPLLGCRPRVLAGVAATCIVVTPLLLFATLGADLPTLDGADPTFGTLVQQPGGLTLDLFLTGQYPALAYLAYLAAGMAIGRLDLSSKRVALWLAGGGAVLAVTAWLASWALLNPLGGLRHLVAAGATAPDDDPGVGVGTAALWEMTPVRSWWWLGTPAPHSNTPLDLTVTLGAAMALLGAMLLLVRRPRVARLLSPVAAAGTLTLTFYCAHAIILRTEVLDDHPTALFLLMVVGMLAFAVAWRRERGQGPLEKLVTVAGNRARSATYQRLTAWR